MPGGDKTGPRGKGDGTGRGRGGCIPEKGRGGCKSEKSRSRLRQGDFAGKEEEQNGSQGRGNRN